nr:homolog of EHV2 ORF63 tegument protein UL37 [Macronycteris gammaherpesvirus 1]
MSSSLEIVTQQLASATTPLKKSKELIDLELGTLALGDLKDSKKITNFLNTLANVENGYPLFIFNHPLYFLLKISSFNQELPIKKEDLTEAINLISSVLDTFKSLKLNGTSNMSNLLENSNIVAQLSQFLQQLRDIDLSVSIVLTPPAVIGTFKFIEEIVFSYYVAYWDLHPKISIPPLNTQSILQQWLISSYLINLKIPHNLNNLPNLKVLAKSLIKTQPDLFIPVSVVTETALTLPWAKTQAEQIFATLDENVLGLEHTPILGFRDSDLLTLSMDYVFLYVHVFEGIFNNNLHSCSKTAIESFLKKSVKFLANTVNFIQITCSNRSSLSLSDIEAVRTFFISHGLSQEVTIALRAILLTSKENINVKIKNLILVAQLMDQVTLFAKYFYLCLKKCSPTSISYGTITDLIQTAYIEQNSYISWSDPNLGETSNWPITPLLKIFIPSPPEENLIAIFKAMPSSLMKNLFGVFVKRGWGTDKILLLAKSTPPSKFQDSSPKKVTRKEVQKFCDSLEIGDTEYPLKIVQSHFFATEFTKTKVVPILQTILSNNVSRNNILPRLKWLITFAFDDALGLYQLRRPLALAFFQLTDIFNHNTANISMESLLNHFQEVITIIKEMISEVPPLPKNFLTHIYQVTFAPMALQYIQDANLFLDESKPIFDALYHLTRISFILCHTNYNYISLEKTIQIPISDTSALLHVPLEVFKDTIRILESSTKEALVILSQACQELHKTYIACLLVMNKNELLEQHSIKIDVSEPNFSKIQGTLLGCFKRYREILALIANSCCFSLTKHFDFLFKPDLISETTIKQILDFSEERDDPAMFMDSIQQPLDITPPNIEMLELKLSKKDIENIQEIYEKFPSIDSVLDPAPSIKLPYTDAMSLSKITIDWDKFAHTTYISQESNQLNFSHITIKNLEQNITGNF